MGTSQEASLFEAAMQRDARLSPCGIYRYALRRQWSSADTLEWDRIVNFVMLNPSTADHQVDDPTIRRCMGFARAWGYHGLIVANLYPFRATSPKDLFASPVRQGESGDPAVNLGDLRGIAASCTDVVCAWGTLGEPSVVAESLKVIRAARDPEFCSPVKALKLTKDGCPSHPLYLPASLVPFEWES